MGNDVFVIDSTFHYTISGTDTLAITPLKLDDA